MKLFDILSDSPAQIADLLCNIAGDYIENKSQLPGMLEHIGYIDNIEDVIKQVNYCEIMFPDNWKINNCQIVSDEAKVDFEMDFILQAFADSFVLRIQGWLKAKITLTDCNDDIQDFDPDNCGLYSQCVRFDDVDYCDIEVDTTYL